MTHARTSVVVGQPMVNEVDDMLGVLVIVTTRSPGPGTLGAVGEVARYAASQIELAELDASRARLDRAEVLALRAREQRNFIATLLLSQGVPMLLHGDELGRTQGGNNNTYCQDNELSLIHISEPTRRTERSRMPSSA